jgi:4-amino-4-deoxy-L-arabinose transferase-like glycosyltransferase
MRSKLISFSLRPHLPILLLLAFCAVIFITTAFEPAVADDADAIHAVAAQEILQRGDWVTLYVNGIRYLQKAPLLYWLVANSYQLFGFNAFAVRFPTMVAVVLLAGTTYLFGCWAFSRKAGLYAAAIMGFSVGIFLFTRIMIPEALLTLLLTIGHFCFLFAFTTSQKRFYYGFYTAAALAVLTKGLIGVIFAIAPALLFLLLTRNLSRWNELRLLSGTAVFLAIAVPWHILAGLQNDHFWWYYFINEHVLRFLGLRYPKDYNKLPFLPYWLLHFLWLFPWSLSLPILLRQTCATRSSQRPLAPLPISQIKLYFWLWAATILIFFSISTSQEYYTFPAYPAFALLIGNSLATAETTAWGQRWLLALNGVLAAIGLLAAGVLGLLIWSAHHVQETGDFSDLLNQQATESEKYTFFLGHALDLTPQAFAALEAPAIAAAVVLSVGLLLALGWRWRQQHGWAVATMVITMGLMFVCANRAHLQFEPILSSRFVANEILQRWQPNAKIVLNESFEVGGSIAFYTQQRVLLLNGRNLVMEFGSRYPDAPPIFINDAELRTLWQSDDRIFLFTEASKQKALLQRLNLPMIPVIENGGKRLWMNR